jgi:hypothetical protein
MTYVSHGLVQQRSSMGAVRLVWVLAVRERERSILYNAVIGFTNVFQLSKLFLLFLFYLLLTHLELLLLHAVVANPELDAEP